MVLVDQIDGESYETTMLLGPGARMHGAVKERSSLQVTRTNGNSTIIVFDRCRIVDGSELLYDGDCVVQRP